MVYGKEFVAPRSHQRDLSEIEQNWEYYRGEHLKHWIGIKPDKTTDIGKKNTEAINRLFQSVNILQKVVDFHVDALIGNDPALTFEGANKTDLDDLGRSLWKNWTSARIGDEFINPISKAVTKAKATGYGYLRIYTPVRFLSNPVLARRVVLHSPDPESVEVLRDNDGFIKEIRYYYQENDQRKTERQFINEQGLTVFEYLDSNGQLEPRLLGDGSPVLTESGDDIEYRTFALNLGGNYTVHELRLEPLVNESTKRNQNAINHALTMIPRGNELSGFLARFFTNGRPPGNWTLKDDGTSEFEADPNGLVIGAGIVNFISGLPIRSQTGDITDYTDVGVHSDPPLPIISFRESFELFNAVIHLQVNQGHLLSYSLTLSGRSREELKSEFVIALTKDQTPVESIVAELLTAAIMMVSPLVGEFTATVQTRLSLGKPSPEERAGILAAYKEGLMSRETAIAQLGYVDDPLAEIDKIKKEKEAEAPPPPAPAPTPPLIITGNNNGSNGAS